uniref:ParA family protein n=1 Tax=Bacteroides fragilis TaxID=817 RepID=UPI003566FF90
MAKIVVFANQKGGVGKSTLAILYANHLTGSDDPDGKGVLVVDTDVQRSILAQRRDDMEQWGEDEMKYAVEYFKLTTMDEAEKMILDAKNKLEDTIVLVDVPGNITDDYIAPLLIYADYIICPYQYENKVLESTTTFIKVLESLRMKFPNKMVGQTIFVPNKIDSREGTKADLEVQKKVDDIMSKYGIVTSKVPSRVDFTRINTYINTPKQEQLVIPCFSDMDKHILSDTR